MSDPNLGKRLMGAALLMFCGLLLAEGSGTSSSAAAPAVSNGLKPDEISVEVVTDKPDDPNEKPSAKKKKRPIDTVAADFILDSLGKMHNNVVVACMRAGALSCDALRKQIEALKVGDRVTLLELPPPSEVIPELENQNTAATAQEPAGDSASKAKAQPSSWDTRLAVARVLVSGGMAYRGASIQSGGDRYQSVTTLIIAGTWAGLMQFKQREVAQWIRTHSLMSRDFEGDPATGRRSFSKKLISSATYALLLQVGELVADTLKYSITGSEKALAGIHDVVSPESALEVARGAGVSAMAQVTLQTVNNMLLERAIQRNPDREYIYKRYSNLATLAQSAVMVALNVANKGGGWAPFEQAAGLALAGATIQYQIDPTFRDLVRKSGLSGCQIFGGLAVGVGAYQIYRNKDSATTDKH